MNYNDYPILTNEEYNILNQNYSLNHHADRKTIITKIFNEITSCKNMCTTLEKSYNLKVKNSIENSNIILAKLCNNFSSICNIDFKTNHSAQTFNIFKLIKKLIKLLAMLTQWQHQENKEYYKTISKNSIFDIIKILEEIISSLENSNIYFFKHM